SEHFKAHFIVHTALLKSASDKVKLTKIMNVEKYENQNYIVKKILKKIKSIKQIIILLNEKSMTTVKISENLLNILKKFSRHKKDRKSSHKKRVEKKKNTVF